MAKWLKETGPHADIVVSTRIRLARNIEGLPFPHLLDEQKSEELKNIVTESVMGDNSSIKNEFKVISMKDINHIDRLNYLEKYLVSPDLIRHYNIGSALINEEETISILINEEDHVRIQCLLPGLQLEKAWELAQNIDDLIEEKIKYAYEEQLGYLTACPTNLGTGVRVSVMLHLPALSLTGHIQGVLKASGQIGLAVRGIYGEGTEFLGHLYQISNQVTLGLTEEEIISNISDVTMQIIQNERSARQMLMNSKRIELEDKIFRSYGILKSARLMSRGEAMQLISNIKLGINLGLIENNNMEILNELIALIQPGCLQKYYSKELSENDRDIKRAQLIREMLI